MEEYLELAEYAELIEANIARLNSATNLGWTYGTTGGGCDAYFLNLGNVEGEGESYFMVTVDASAPTTDEEWAEITLGRYSEVNDEGSIADWVTTFDELVEFFTAFGWGL
jgi:hypothetical protein